jgi:hypothetical protein
MERLIDPAMVVIAVIILTLYPQRLEEVVHDVCLSRGKFIIDMAIRLKAYDAAAAKRRL